MVEKTFLELIDKLERDLAQAPESARHEMQAELHRTVDKMRQAGLTIPARLADLDIQAVEDEIEDRFDNLPL